MSRFTFLSGLAALAAWIAVSRLGPSGTETGTTGSSASGPKPILRNRVKHVVVFIQENHTTDNYFRGLRPYGANVATDWPEQQNPPRTDQPHDRRAYARWLQNGTATRTQFDTLAVIPFYAYLAVTGAFLENHCSGFGTSSTPNHLLLLGGQSPTLRNPEGDVSLEWDMPSVPGLAGEAGLSWRCYTAGQHYPARYYTQLKDSSNLVATSAFAADAATGSLPALSYVWHQGPGNEHPTQNVTAGMNSVWQAVDAVVKSGNWDDTVFLLTWDDWGGWDDHVKTPDVEHTPDGVQLAYGPRVPLLMFGGSVRRGIDSRWSSHVGVAKTVMQLLGLPPLGVERVDTDPGLADLVDPSLHQPPPPAYGSLISMPPPPSPMPDPAPLPPAPAAASIPVPPVILRNGTTLPPPHDALVPAAPPSDLGTDKPA
jgi:phospholipase C